MLVSQRVSVARDGLSQPECGFFSEGEIVAGLPVSEMPELIFRPAQTAGEDSMAGETVGRLVHLAGANDDELLQLGGDGAGVEHSRKVVLHGGEDLRAMRHDAKHVWHVAALGEDLVVTSCNFRGYVIAIEAGNARHGGSCAFESIMAPEGERPLAERETGSEDFAGVALTEGARSVTLEMDNQAPDTPQ